MAIDVSRLRVSVEEGERWRRTLRITVPSEIVQAERRAAMKKLSSGLKLPGFRAGKVPEAVLEKRFGPAVEQELLDRVIGEAYRSALREQALRPISDGEVGEVEYQPQADLTFRISFDVAPVVKLARVGGFKVERPSLPVPDEDVDKVLERIREQKGTWVPIEEEGTPSTGERVSVRIERLDAEGEEPRRYEFVLGQGEAIPEVEGAIGSLAVGSSGEFMIHIPADSGPEAASAEERRLRIYLDGRKRLELPPLDDALAKAAGEFQTLEELRSRVREDLLSEAKREEEARLRALLVEQIVAANPFEVPESMVNQFVRSALGDPKEVPEERFAEVKEQLRPRAIQAVKRFLVVNEVSESRGLRATEEEVDARIEELADKGRTNPSDLYARLQKAGHLEQLEREITERKVFDFLKGESNVVEAA
jgi:trigger factor